MGYFKGFITTLGITLPSFLFIQIYLEGITVNAYFSNLNNDMLEILKIFDTAIMEPITIFFVPFDAIRMTLAFLPWIVAAFVCSFFFRKKHGARGGLVSVVSTYTSIAFYYYFMIAGGSFDTSVFTQPNLVYGYLVVLSMTSIIGLFSGLISPFKKEQLSERKSSGAVVMTRGHTREAQPVPYSSEDTEPYYMPIESPSRSAYMENQQRTPSRNNAQPLVCEYCGSYIDADSEFCSVCGNRVTSEY